jgi:serine phosphatase RsbU (regulator of sigma subunit)
VLHTDGLTEGRADPGSDERFGVPRLLHALQRIAGEPLDHATLRNLAAGITAANGGPLPDDVAILAVEVLPPPRRT